MSGLQQIFPVPIGETVLHARPARQFSALSGRGDENWRARVLESPKKRKIELSEAVTREKKSLDFKESRAAR
jgi:hypothetical protein